MHKDSKIYVAGHRGLVGSALIRRLQAGGYTNIITRPHAELDLTDQQAVQDFFQKNKPEYVFLAAAKVGGIVANNTYPAEFIYRNLMIETNVIHEAYKNEVKKLLFLGSSCIYPKHAPQPMKEGYLLTGLLEPTNEPYAISKITGIKMCSAYNRQYGTNFMCVMPTNVYGPGDNYDLRNSHVLPALIRKTHDAIIGSERRVVVWGTGSPRREFLYSDDLANASIFLMKKYNVSDLGDFINIGVGKDNSIKELAEQIKEVLDYKGGLEFDTTQPDGAPQKLLDVTRLNDLGWTAQTSLRKGIKLAYEDFLKTYGL